MTAFALNNAFTLNASNEDCNLITWMETICQRIGFDCEYKAKVIQYKFNFTDMNHSVLPPPIHCHQMRMTLTCQHSSDLAVCWAEMIGTH